MAYTQEQVRSLWLASLAKLEPEIIRPLKNYTWTRDLPLKEDLDKVTTTIAFRTIKGVAQGTKDIGGKSWIGKDANDLRGVEYEIGGSAVRVFTAGREISVTNMQLEEAMRTENINVDAEQLELVNDIYQTEAQETAYLGDSGYGFTGLLNSSDITKGTAKNVLSGTGTDKWDKVCAAVDNYFMQAYKNASEVIMPNVMLLSPSMYVDLFSLKAPDDRHFSMVDYIEKESLGARIAGSMKVNQVKELSGIGTSNKDRIVLYTNDERYLRFHLKSVWREKSYDTKLEFCSAYLWRFSEVQFRRPETLMYFDGI